MQTEKVKKIVIKIDKVFEILKRKVLAINSL